MTRTGKPWNTGTIMCGENEERKKSYIDSDECRGGGAKEVIC